MNKAARSVERLEARQKLYKAASAKVEAYRTAADEADRAENAVLNAVTELEVAVAVIASFRGDS